MEPKKLSRDQDRVLREALRRRELLAISAMTLLEIALIVRGGTFRGKLPAGDIFDQIESSPAFHLLPITVRIAAEVVALGDGLRDPGDRVIVATARIHNLRLITSDQRIIDSKLVPVVV